MTKRKTSRGYRLFLMAMILLLALGIWVLITGIKANQSAVPVPDISQTQQGRLITVVL